MRNKIDFSLAPEDLFLDPLADPGLAFLSRPDFIWRLHPPGRIEGFSVADHASIRSRTERFLRYTRQHKTFRKAIEFKTALVQLSDASFRKSYSMAGGKCLLSGAAGMRLLNRYCWENQDQPDNPEDRLVRYFSARQACNDLEDLPCLTAPPPPDIDFAIECRNTFNFYHFITETLCHLCLLAETDFSGRIFIHFPNAPEKTRAFTTGFVAALFPEFVGRVFFERAPKDYARVLSAYSLFNSHYFLPPEATAPLDDFAPSDEMWKGPEATRSSSAVLSMNSIDSSLVLLRKRALAAIEGRETSHLPRRFFVGRRPGQSRHRNMKGEAELIEVLSALGFEQLTFEDLEPLDQIALMAHAEIMISPHGAGFANMLFAHSDALVIELGTLQTAVHRWGDFWPLAIVSGCRYVSFFADYNSADPLNDPRFSTDGIIPVALGRRGLGEVLAFVASSIGRLPRLSRGEDVSRLVHQLNRTGQSARADEILAKHADLMSNDVDLSLAAAGVHKARGEVSAELMALTLAWEADPARWQTLVQIIWAARKAGQADILSWAVQRLADDFPERCLELVKDRDWLREFL
ncbi:glycosyltransferase family 61 protein [Pseudotabrizicola sp. L79]|uniref:glycosyltransferase family 61 protein n=1 Tax=Pseudotabrizicola sp. L79 TaxID=3118402 RepID=UPI002F947F7D